MATTLLVVVIRKEFGRARSVLLWVALPTVLAVIPWFLYRAGIPRANVALSSHVTVERLVTLFGRVPDIAERAWFYLTDTDAWLFWWPQLVLLFLVTARHWLKTPLLAAFLAAQLPLIAYGVIYIIHPWSPQELMEVTTSRLVLHTVPLQFWLAGILTHRANLIPDALYPVPKSDTVNP